MTTSAKLTVLAVAAMALTGCAAGSSGSGSTTGSAGSAVPSAAEQACLRDVTRTTNNPDVVLLGSNPYQGGGTYVRVGVGPSRAPWQCIGSANGTTTEIMSLTNEGRL